jgi:hypothetical protein
MGNRCRAASASVSGTERHRSILSPISHTAKIVASAFSFSVLESYLVTWAFTPYRSGIVLAGPAMTCRDGIEQDIRPGLPGLTPSGAASRRAVGISLDEETLH